MRKIILFLLNMSCAFIIIAQNHSMSEISNLCINGQYEQAIPDLRIYVEKGNSDAMVLLADCIRQNAKNNYNIALKNSGSDLFTTDPYAYAMKLMNMSPYEIQTLQNQLYIAQNAIHNADIEAMNLYVAASNLGNTTADNRIKMLSVIYSKTSNSQTNIPPSGGSTPYSTSPISTPGSIQRVTCPSCKGTKVQESPSYGPAFGLDRSSDKQCPVCGKYENHYHANCISCQGTGYVKKYVP